SGYRAGQSPEESKYPSETEIKEDLDLLLAAGFSFLRLFDCSTHTERVLKVIADNHLDIRVASGVWISGGKAAHDKENQAQIEQCVTLDNRYKDIIVGVSVGNETLDDWSSVKVAPAELVEYIQSVRSRVPQPVTTDDMYLPFTLAKDGDVSYADVEKVAR